MLSLRPSFPPSLRLRFAAPAALAAASLAAGASAQVPAASLSAAAKDTPVQLDRFDVSAGKESHFSLPLDAVVASGSRLGLTGRELPASVSVVTQEMMRFRGLATAVEAVEAAVGMTGGTNFGSIPVYSTRGFGGNNVSVLRDGIRQNTASQSSRTVDSFLFDRIEILKGPDGLMFGEGAIGGAVNYISKSPGPEPRRDLLATGGAHGYRRLGLGLGGPISFGAPGSAGATAAPPSPLNFRADYAHLATDGHVDRNAQRYDAVALSLGLRVSENLALAAFGTFLDDRNESYYGAPVVYDAVVDTTAAAPVPEVRLFNAATDRMVNPRLDPAARRTNYNILDNFAAAENAFARLRADLRLSPGLDLRHESYLATQLLRWRNAETSTWNPVARRVVRAPLTLIYRDDVLLGHRLDLTAKHPLAGRAHRFVAGALLERNDQIRGGAPGNLALALPAVSLLDPAVGSAPPTRFQKTSRVVAATHAVHAQDVLDLAPGLRLVAGLRHDRIALRRDTLANPTLAVPVPFSSFRKNYRASTGRVGAVWTVARTANAYVSFSRAAEPVTQLVSLTSANNDFSLQKGRQAEAGLKGTVLRGHLDFTVALFDLLKKDLLTSTVDAVTGVRTSQQIGAQRARGAEVALALSPGVGWHLEANAAFTAAEFVAFNENLGAGVVSRAGRRPANVPVWVANLFVAKRFARGFAVSGGPRYVGERYGNTANSVVAASYVAVDATVSYAWARWHLALRGRNLLDAEYEPVAGTSQRRLADPRTADLSLRTAF